MSQVSSRYLGLLVFTTGACTMGAEIAGARLLAPYFGDSTIVWANTIAIVLVALSIGYWLGGKLADRRPELHSLCWTVLGGAVLVTLIPFFARPFLGASVDAFDELSIGVFAGSLVGVLVLLAIPVMIFGAVSPWALRIAMDSSDVEHAGQLAGRLYALSTAGSLVGTLLSAMVTIPLIGTQRTFIVFALVVAVVASVGVRKLWPALIPAAVACASLIPVGTIKAAGEGDVIFETETPHQYVRVVEMEDGERRLELNEGQAIHSIYRPGEYLVGNYWDEHLVLPFVVAPAVTGAGQAGSASLTTTSPPVGPWPERIAILGNAAGTVARAYGHFFPETKVDAVEIDGEVSEVGREYFGMENPNMEVISEDARPWLRAAEPIYDVIMVDAYHQPYIPFYMATREFFELVRDRLKPGGVVLINVGHPENSDALEKNLTATLEKALPFVLRDPVTDTNTMLAGSADPIAPGNILRATRGKGGSPIPVELDELASSTAVRIEPGLSGGDVWTDDHAPVEWLVDLSLLEYAGE